MINFTMLFEEIKHSYQIFKLRYKFRKTFPHASKNFAEILERAEAMIRFTHQDEVEIDRGMHHKPLFKNVFNAKMAEYLYLYAQKKADSKEKPTKVTYSYLPHGNK